MLANRRGRVSAFGGGAERDGAWARMGAWTAGAGGWLGVFVVGPRSMNAA